MTESTKTQRRILVIDDDRDVWKAYIMVLNPERVEAGSSLEKINRLLAAEPTEQNGPGFTLTFASQGQEGYGMVQEALRNNEPFALAFVDVRMPPGWDGMETAARIRQLDPDIELVIVTAYSDRSREEIVRAVGSSTKLLFFRKPFAPEELMQLAISLTDKWQLARQEEQQRHELQAVLHASPAAIFVLDASGRIASWNAAAERITGIPAAEVMGKPCIFQRIADDPFCQSCPGAGAPAEFGMNREIIIRGRAGEKRTVVVNMAPDVEGITGKTIGSFWDITSIREAEAALAASECRFRALVETTSDFVWEVDRDGRFLYCSPVCRDLYGYTPEELLGKCIFDVLPEPGGLERFRTIFSSCVESGSKYQTVERNCQKKSGETIFVESSGTPVFNDKGQVIGYRGIDRDISLRKKNEADRLRLEERSRQSQKLEALGTLAGGLAHDLNNILTPIMGHCTLGKIDTSPEHPLYQSFDVIESCSNKAAELIRRILAFCRKQEMNVQPVNLNQLIHDFTKMLRRLIREDIHLVLALQENLWPITADRSQMEQILINLVVNARDAMEEGGELIIRTENRTLGLYELYDANSRVIVGDFVVFTVCDQGAGIDPQKMNMIFDPFFTTKGVGKGTGLGLATVHGIVAQHGGHIVVTSEAGKGSTFMIFLPKGKNSVEKKPATREPIQLKQGSETILVAEDDPTVLKILEKTLTEAGYQTLLATNGNIALEIFEKEGDSIDLLITDLIMPGQGGKALGKMVRAKAPDLPILYITGYSFDIAMEELAGEENANYLQKPFHMDHFTATVRNLLDQK